MSQPKAKPPPRPSTPDSATVTVTPTEDGYRVEALAREIYLGMLATGQHASKTCEYLAMESFDQAEVFCDEAERRRSRTEPITEG